MQNFNLEVQENQSRQRMDKFLVGALGKKYSRTFIRKLIDDERVLLNDELINAHHLVCAGDRVSVTIPEPEPLELLAQNLHLDILHEDPDVIVINKPYGLSVHPSGRKLKDTLVNGLLWHCRDLSGIGGVLRPGIVHRLDKDTTGILVAAKNDKAHINLSNQFKNRRVKRAYIALVRGIVQLDNGILDAPIARHSKDATKMAVSFVGDKKKTALTHYRVLRRFKDFTELELSLQTGRTHQIRVHTAHMGHPVLGDTLYGSGKGIARQALHAKTLGFFHPSTGKFMEFDSEIPGDMTELIRRGHI